MTSAARSQKTKPSVPRSASADLLPARNKLPNTRLRNVLYLAKLVCAFALVPLWPVFIAWGARDPYYVNHYFETIWHSLRTLKTELRTGSLFRIFKYNLLTSPRRMEAQIASRLGACTRCAKCCKILRCDFLSYSRSSRVYYCSVYNTPYWIFGACGRFPIDQADIEAYNCPGFAFPESVAPRRKAAEKADAIEAR